MYIRRARGERGPLLLIVLCLDRFRLVNLGNRSCRKILGPLNISIALS